MIESQYRNWVTQNQVTVSAYRQREIAPQAKQLLELTGQRFRDQKQVCHVECRHCAPSQRFKGPYKLRLASSTQQASLFGMGCFAPDSRGQWDQVHGVVLAFRSGARSIINILPHTIPVLPWYRYAMFPRTRKYLFLRLFTPERSSQTTSEASKFAHLRPHQHRNACSSLGFPLQRWFVAAQFSAIGQSSRFGSKSGCYQRHSGFQAVLH